jgi:rubrerythrin
MTTATANEKDQQLALLFQYTIEAYKYFQKCSEIVQNPMSALMFSGFAKDERQNRDILEIKYLRSENTKIPLTLGNDLRFQDIFEGDLSDREKIEMLMAREQTMERKLGELSKTGAEEDRNLFHYIAATKKAHIALLNRELELAKVYKKWLSREDAEDLVVHGEDGA